MIKQFELFDEDKKPKERKKKLRQPKFEAIIDGFGIETVNKTEKEHECFACRLSIPVGSKAKKQTPVVDDRPLWYQTIYKHVPSCPLPEDEP